VILTENKFFSLKIHCRGWAAKRLNHARIVESLLYLVEALCHRLEGHRFDSWWSFGFFSCPNPSSHTLAFGTAQPLTEMCMNNLPGVNDSHHVRLTVSPPYVSWLYRTYGNLNISQPYGPTRPNSEITLLFSHYESCWRYEPLSAKVGTNFADGAVARSV
jgi:hypothetical protein